MNKGEHVMPNDTFVMSVRQAAELDHAFSRNGWTPEDVKWLSAGNNLASVLEVRRGDVRLVESDFFREPGELTIQIPALARPTLKELQSKYDWIKSIERDSSPIEAVTLKLATILRENEGSISGKEYEKRVAGKLDIILGYQQAVWLVEHQDEFPEFMALLGKVYIDFTGLVVVRRDGYRHYPCLGQNDRQWSLSWYWVDLDFSSSGHVAISGK